MSKYGFFQAKLGSPGAMAIVADTLPTPQMDMDDRPGWKYTKDMGSNPTDKFNYYFYGGALESLKCKNVSSLFMCGSVDKWTNQTNECPFFVLYTKMKGDGTDTGSWYHSRHAFSLHKESQLIRAGERCVFYAVGEPMETFEGARKIRLNTRTDTGVWNGENEVMYCTVQSDSGAVAMECLTEHMGMNCHSFDRQPASCINFKCIA